MRFFIRRVGNRFTGIRQKAMLAVILVGAALPGVGLGQQAYYAGPGASDGPTAAPVRRVAPVVTQNFIIYAADTAMANRVAQEAERYRKELALEWLGRELEPWDQKCPITVEVGEHAGGETSFAFMVNDASGQGRPVDWQMKIYGPPNRLLDAVLPHEITHTIFASHFRQPLPRWADEGACTTVEHVSERDKNHRMLIEFLSSTPSRGIPFNRMFTMKQYPDDILPLYAQGYSLAKFLILQKGRRHFLNFVGKGLHGETQGSPLQAWDQATKEFYGYSDLSDLQLKWESWVRNGSSEVAFQRDMASQNSVATQVQGQPSNPAASLVRGSMVETFTNANSGSWYAREISKGRQSAGPGTVWR